MGFMEMQSMENENDGNAMYQLKRLR
jgi:hypothetical protein